MVPLAASTRDLRASPKALRRSKQVPCVVYGQKTQMNVQCPAQELHNAFVKAGESTLVALDVEGKKIPVLFKAVDFDPVSDREIHADFYAVNMEKEIETLVPLHFEGEAPAVKTLGGVLVIAHDHVKVRCLPKNLPHSITVNIATLEEFHSSLYIRDLQIPQGVQVMDRADSVLITVQEPRAIEEVAIAAPAVAEGEAATATSEAGAEGASAAAGGTASTAEAQAKEKVEKGSKERGAEKGKTKK